MIYFQLLSWTHSQRALEMDLSYLNFSHLKVEHLDKAAYLDFLHATAKMNRIFSDGVNLAFVYTPQLCNKIVFLVSFVGNRGTFTRGYRAVIMDMAFLYHVAYVLVCMLGLCVHEFFYSFLVSLCFCRGENFAKIENTVTHAAVFNFFLTIKPNHVYF